MREAAAAATAVLAAIHHVEGVASSIAGAVEQQGSATAEIASRVTGVAEMASRISHVMEEIVSGAAAGTLTSLQTISTLPPGEAVPKGTSTAEVQVHPNGRFLYGSNRGANTLVVYAIAEKTGQLTYVESVSTLGKTPRHFALDPTGTWLLAENQDSSTVAVFRVDPKTGRLTPSGPLVAVPAPVSAVFVPVP